VDVSSDQSGTIRDVLVDYNRAGKKGEVVARLDTAKLEANVKSAEANLLSAKASVAKADADMKSAKATFDRLKSLVSSRVSTQQEMDAAGFTYEAAIATKASTPRIAPNTSDIWKPMATTPNTAMAAAIRLMLQAR